MTKTSFLILIFAFFLCGCRCGMHSASSLARTDTATIDVRFRSLSQLWDTLAEKQTIHIEFYPPDYTWLGTTEDLGSQQADTTTTAAIVGSPKPSGIGGGMSAIKSIDIETERNSGSLQQTSTDSSMLSQNSTKETLQKEAASEARHDNGTVAIVSVVAAVVLLLALLIIIKKISNK